MSQPPSTRSEFWREFAEALTRKQEKRPEGKGWLTFRELVVKFRPAGKCTLRKTLTCPSVERFKGFVTNKDGKLVKQTWYRSR